MTLIQFLGLSHRQKELNSVLTFPGVVLAAAGGGGVLPPGN